MIAALERLASTVFPTGGGITAGSSLLGVLAHAPAGGFFCEYPVEEQEKLGEHQQVPGRCPRGMGILGSDGGVVAARTTRPLGAAPCPARPGPPSGGYHQAAATQGASLR